MASAKLLACLPIVFEFEGGYSSDRNDPGNWTGGKVGKGKLVGTKWGIAAASHPGLDIPNLTIEQAAAIYEKNYWAAVKGDALPDGIDLAVFDYGVNSGPTRASKSLQKAVGVAADGKVGPVTLAAALAAKADAVIVEVSDERLGFVQSLTTWARYGKGWARRIGTVKARALLMAGAAVEALQREAANDNRKADADTKRAAQTGTAGAATGGGAVAADQAGQIDWIALAGLGAAAVILIGVAVILARRAAARREIAAGVALVAATNNRPTRKRS